MIEPSASQLRLLVYRSGPLAQLGHNHVIETHALSGWVLVAEPQSQSSLRLQFAPADLIVDDPESRRQEGADFADEVSDDARSGTRSNMLGPKLLDAERHPLVSIESIAIEDGTQAPTARLKIDLAGQAASVSAPFTFERGATTLSIKADFPLRQSALGLTPFSALLGALRVEDELRIKLSLSCALSP